MCNFITVTVLKHAYTVLYTLSDFTSIIFALCISMKQYFGIFDLKLLYSFLQTQWQFLLWRDNGSGVKHKCNILHVIYYLTKEINCSELGFIMTTNSSVNSILMIFFLIYCICSGLICQHLLPVSQKVFHRCILFCIIF